MAQTLHQRQSGYEDAYSQNIISRIPIIIKLDGRSFQRVTRNVPKPFCSKISAMFNGTMVSLAKQIDGVLFGYQYSDKIILVLRNDRSQEEDPWFGNNIQKIVSVSASLATYEFMNQLWQMKEAPDLDGVITFSSKVFGVPNINEAINYLIFSQFKCVQTAINECVQTVLWPKYGRQTPALIEDKGVEDRRKILEDSDFDFDSLPAAYRHGTGAYLTPRLVNTAQGQVTHHKWLVDFNLPLFTDSKDKLRTILTTGSDIFRPERDL